MNGELEVMRATRLASLPDRHPNRPQRPAWLLPPVRDARREARKKGKGRAAG